MNLKALYNQQDNKNKYLKTLAYLDIFSYLCTMKRTKL